MITRLPGPFGRPRRGAGGARRLPVTLLLLAALLLTSCDLVQRKPAELPVPLAQVIPEEWRLLDTSRGQLDIQAVNIDDDDETEWMIFFHYDNIAGTPENPGPSGPVGGVIYDAQQDTNTYGLPTVPDEVVPFPYQPSAFLVPYRLLPDWRSGKGQGYLGDTTVTWEEVRTTAPDPRNNELYVYGRGPGNIVTRLSVFIWQDIINGYDVAYFHGSYRVNTRNKSENDGRPISEVVALDRLNERSNLCQYVKYERQGESIDFTATAPTIVFCQAGNTNQVPDQPTYPEAVVLAELLVREDKMLDPEPPGGLDQLKAKLKELLATPPSRVLSLSYVGVGANQGTGTDATSTVSVETIVEQATGLQQTIRWDMRELRPTETRQTSRWRISGVEQVAP